MPCFPRWMKNSLSSRWCFTDGFVFLNVLHAVNVYVLYHGILELEQMYPTVRLCNMHILRKITTTNNYKEIQIYDKYVVIFLFILVYFFSVLTNRIFNLQILWHKFHFMLLQKIQYKVRQKFPATLKIN